MALAIQPQRSRPGAETLARVKPLLRGWIHQVACLASIPAGVGLVFAARGTTPSIVAAVFALSLTLLLGTSALYHRINWTDRMHRLMKHLDHSMIYVLIAGSYTPLLFLALNPGWNVAFVIAVWFGAGVGVAVTLWRLDKYAKLGAALYIMLGWVGLLALPQLIGSLSAFQMGLLAGGGVLYTVGAIILATNRPNPNPRVFGYHEIFHGLGVIAAGCHYVLILTLVS
jgi:hemolysin III